MNKSDSATYQVVGQTLIRASAGTGKTRELSSRYISLLARGETPDRILATTFTRKAAAEIRERIFSRLSAASASQTAARAIGSEIGQPQMQQSDIRGILKRLVERQHRLLITTLDALFISMARAFALELGLPINWRIASEEDTSILRELAIKGVLQGGDLAKPLEILRMLYGGDLKRSVYRGVIDSIERLYRYYVTCDSAAWEWLTLDGASNNLLYQRAGARITSYQVPTTKKGEPNKVTAKLIDKIRRSHANYDWKALGSISAFESALEGSYTSSGKPLDPALIDIIEDLLELSRYDSKQRIRDKLIGARTMLSMYHHHYRQAQRKLGLLTFDDIKERLAASSIIGELAPLYYRLDSRICHILLDEFQDTSLNEWKIIEPIADEILSRPTERSFFCVGDLKQAIYGWRGGVAEIFGSIERRWPNLKPETKQTTYRCAPAVIAFVNQLFAGIAGLPCTSEVSSAVSRWLKRFEPHDAARGELAGKVELHRLADGESHLKFTVDLVSELRTKHPNANIGVLVRRNATVSGLLASFAAARPDIAVSEEGAVKITDSAVVRTLMSLLRAIDHPGDKLAAFHVGQSTLADTLKIPFIGDRLAEDWCQTIRKSLLDNGYASVVSLWVRELLPVALDLDRQRLEQLVDQAQLYDLERTTSPSDFVRQIEKISVELPSDASVRVMSLHKSKGLEFDIVVLPELNLPIAVKPSEVLIAQESPIAAIDKISIGASNKFERALIPELQEMWRAKLDAITVESLSLLYVGVTRPKQILHLVLPEDKAIKKLSPAKIISESFPGDLSRTLLFGSDEVGIASDYNEERLSTKRGVFRGPFEFAPANGKGRSPKLNQISPSIHGREIKLVNPGTDREATLARDRGSALHLLFEQIGWIEEFDPQALDLSGLLMSFGSEVRERVLGEFYNLIKNSVIGYQLSRARFDAGARVELMREQPFAVRDGESLVSGVIDRLVITYIDGAPVSAEVIDYKSDRLVGDRSAESFAVELKRARYAEQIDFYTKAVRGLLAKEIAVTGKILLLDGPVVVEV
jgi:ATP-dependent helicase/nuclease subunit A